MWKNALTITWTGIPTPDSIDINYLTNYFASNVYKYWGDKYLNERINYNNEILGNVAYSIYIDNEYIATTTKTNYTYTEPINKDIEIKIVTTYTNYKACDSDGISTIVKALDNSNPINNEINDNTNIEISFIDYSAMYKNDFEIMESAGTLATVLEDGKNVTNNAKIVINKNDSSLYIITVTYKNKTAQKKISIIDSN